MSKDVFSLFIYFLDKIVKSSLSLAFSAEFLFDP
jgi:hypothetical protein